MTTVKRRFERNNMTRDELKPEVERLIDEIVTKFGSQDGNLKINLELLVATVRVQLLEELQEKM